MASKSFRSRLRATVAAAQRTRVRYTLPQAAQQHSEIITDLDGTVRCQLAKGEPRPAGTYTRTVPTHDDAGAAFVPGARYRHLRVSGTYNPSFQGLVGNNSASATGDRVWTMHTPNNLYYCQGRNQVLAHQGLNEGSPASHFFRPDALHELRRFPDFYGANSIAFSLSCARGNIAFLCSNEGAFNNEGENGYGYVVAQNLDNYTYIHNASGVALRNGEFGGIRVTDKVDAINNCATGLDVQQVGAGHLLAVVHGRQQLVKLYDVRNVSNITLAYSFSIEEDPAAVCAFDANGRLWVTNDTQLWCYDVNGSTAQLVNILDGFTDLVNVACHPTDPNVLHVVDGGAAPKIYRVAVDTGAKTLLVGRRSYAADGPAYDYQKLSLRLMTLGNGVAGSFYKAPLTIAPDGSWWTSDYYSKSVLHLDATGALLDAQFMQEQSYEAAVCEGDPERVFLSGNEWRLPDPNRPETATLVNVWAALTPASLSPPRQVVTLGGRTFALMPSATFGQSPELVELVEGVGVRRQNVRFYNRDLTTVTFGPGGRLEEVERPHDRALGSPYRWRTADWTGGFDANDWPVWQAFTTQLSRDKQAEGDGGAVWPDGGDGLTRYCRTDSGNFLLASASQQDGYHVECVNPSGKTLWQGGYARKDVRGPNNVLLARGTRLEEGDDFENNPPIQRTSNTFRVVGGRLFIVGFHGELMRFDSTASQWGFYTVEGLFIRKFGNYGVGYGVRQGAQALVCGNSFSWCYFERNGEHFLLINSEYGNGAQVLNITSLLSVEVITTEFEYAPGVVEQTLPASGVVRGLTLEQPVAGGPIAASWQPVPGASHYQVWAGPQPRRLTLVAEPTTAAATLPAGPGVLFVSVRAMRAGVAGPYSAQRSLWRSGAGRTLASGQYLYMPAREFPPFFPLAGQPYNLQFPLFYVPDGALSQAVVGTAGVVRPSAEYGGRGLVTLDGFDYEKLSDTQHRFLPHRPGRYRVSVLVRGAEGTRSFSLSDADGVAATQTLADNGGNRSTLQFDCVSGPATLTASDTLVLFLDYVS